MVAGLPGAIVRNKLNASAMYSLSSFIAQHPNARIVNDKFGGGVRIQAGGTPMADHFLGNADASTIGINGKTTVYDFELDMDRPPKRRVTYSVSNSTNKSAND